MSHERRELRQLKMDMLRVRGQLQREDMLLALQDIRDLPHTVSGLV